MTLCVHGSAIYPREDMSIFSNTKNSNNGETYSFGVRKTSKEGMLIEMLDHPEVQIVHVSAGVQNAANFEHKRILGQQLRPVGGPDPAGESNI